MMKLIQNQGHMHIGSKGKILHARVFVQLFIYDIDNEVPNRMQAFGSFQNHSDINELVVQQLIKMFNETNVIIKAFRITRERFKESDYVSIRLKLIGERIDKQYYDPTFSEVVALIMGNVQELIHHRDIVV